MNCPKCHGTGREVCKYHRTVDGVHESYDMIGGLCSTCHGQRVIYCCEGDREQAMLNATEVNPNEVG